MRVSTAVLCTLVTLACEELPQRAIAATPEPPVTPASDLHGSEAATLAPAEHSITPDLETQAISFPEFTSAVKTLKTDSSPASLIPVNHAAEPTVASAVEPTVASAAEPTVEPAIAAAVEPVINAAVEPEISGSVEAALEPMAEPGAVAALDEGGFRAIAQPERQGQPERLSENLLATPEAPGVLANLLMEVGEGDGIPIPIVPAETAQTPPAEEIEAIQERLRNLGQDPNFGDTYEGSPAITIANPSGYGADAGIGFVGFGFQTSVRGSDEADATLNAGIGLGDATNGVGVQLSYTLASLGSNRDFGSGGFNAKIHRRFAENWSIAAGWEGFLTLGDPVDFEDTLYSSITYVAETTPDLNDPFSRIALTAGVGNGRFRSLEDIEDGNDTIGVFGSMAVRIARPVSAIVEWTGQDLALGVSIAPFRDFPLVITPALRDVAGAGDGPRLVLGAGLSFRF